MIVINYNTAFKALDAYIKAYNSRTEDLSLQVRQSVASTAKELIRIYGISLVKANGIEKFDKENLPSLKTNNVQLSKLSNSSTRTVQRHIKKLMQAGVITKKIWHGTNSSYELWINPNILLVKEKESQKVAKRLLNEVIEKTSLMAQNEQFEQEQTTKCLHTESCDTSNKNNTVIGVRNSENVSQEQGISDTKSLAPTVQETLQATIQKGVSIRSRIIKILPATLETLYRDTQGKKLRKKLKVQGKKCGIFEPMTKRGT